MNKSIIFQVLKYLIIFYILSIFVLGVFSVFYTASFEDKILDSFTIGFILQNTLYLFIKYFLTINITCIIVSYSLFIKPPVSITSNTTEFFYTIATPVLILFLILASIHFILINFVGPSLAEEIKKTQTLSKIAGNYLVELEKAIEKGDSALALKYYDLYLLIDDNDYFREQREAISLELESFKEDETRQDNETGMEEEELNSMLSLAFDYFQREDYFAAHYYASLALELDELNTEAKMLLDKSWDMIQSSEPSKSEIEKRELFESKIEGYNALYRKDYIEAYYIFKALKEKYPHDNEVDDFFLQSLELLNTKSFNYEEAEDIMDIPGYEHMAFINKKTEDAYQFIYIDKLVIHKGEIYFHDIEILSFDLSGFIIDHLRAEYGKLYQSYINLNYFQSEQDITFTEDKLIELEYDPFFLPFFQLVELDLKTLNTPQLFELNNPFIADTVFQKAGFDTTAIEMEILERIFLSLFFLILSLLSVSFGWSFRARYLDRPPLLTYISLPILPFILHSIIVLCIFFHRIILGFILLSTGFMITIVVLLVIEFVLLVFAFIILAGQRTV